MHSTLRSEVDVFRLAVIIALGALAVGALAVGAKPLHGVLLGAALVLGGIGLALWRARGGEPRRVRIARAPGDGRHRILVIANETVGGAALGELRNHARGRSCEVLVVSPAATGSELKRWTTDFGDARAEAERRCLRSVRAIEAAGLAATGEVGDADPSVAIESALLRFPADEMVICTHPPGRADRLERGAVEKARAEVGLPITQLVVE
ncbi:MAG: hypothetical protein U0R52_02830 [Solirubrobacterales bacterium]